MRFRTLLIPVAAVGLLAACGDNPTKSGGSSPTTTVSAGSSPSTTAAPVSGCIAPAADAASTTAVGALVKPIVKIPATLPTQLVITDLTEGTGPAAVAGDAVIVNYVGVRSVDCAEFDNSYDRNTPFPVAPLGTASVIDGWNQGLVGIKKGGRRQLDIPAALAYGDTPKGGIIQPGDALTFVIDVVAIVPKTDPANAPKISIPATPNQTTQTFTDLIVGTGAAINPGQTIAIHLVAISAADGKQLQSTWETGAPLTFKPDDGQTLPSLVKGIEGMKVGGRREVIIPFTDAFGPTGNTSLGLPPSTDLILIIDLISVF